MDQAEEPQGEQQPSEETEPSDEIETDIMDSVPANMKSCKSSTTHQKTQVK